MSIKEVNVVQGSVKPMTLEARLFWGISFVTFNNGQEPEEVYFKILFNHDYDPTTRQFKPKINPKTGEPWGYVKYTFESAVVMVLPMSYNNELTAKIREYFDRQFKEQF